MDAAGGRSTANETGVETGVVTVRYWAAARAAAGVERDELAVGGPVTLAEVVRRAAGLHPEGGLPRVLAICSVLVGERPAGSGDRAEVWVSPGEIVEFLPPFAGG